MKGAGQRELYEAPAINAALRAAQPPLLLVSVSTPDDQALAEPKPTPTVTILTNDHVAAR